jgi:hypothetical protein
MSRAVRPKWKHCHPKRFGDPAQVSDLNGSQGWNRTIDTPIVNPPHFASSVTQVHPKEGLRRFPPYSKCWWMTLHDPGLETKVQTWTIQSSNAVGGSARSGLMTL